MSWTTMACFVEPRRRGLADLRLWGGGLSRCTAGVRERILGSEKDTSSPNHDGCILQFDVILQDVCGNVHFHCGICSNIFLLASRYNKKRQKRNPISKRTVLFEQWGPTLQSRAQGRNSGKRGWSCLLYSLSVQPAREQGLENIQGMPGGLKWGRVDRLEPPHTVRVQSPYSHQRQA